MHKFLKVGEKNLILNLFMQVIEAQVDMPILGAVTLYSSLLTFTLHVHPDRLDYVDQVLVCFIFKLLSTFAGLVSVLFCCLKSKIKDIITSAYVVTRTLHFLFIP